MNYRSSAKKAARTLVVRNHGYRLSTIMLVMGVVAFAAGIVMVRGAFLTSGVAAIVVGASGALFALIGGLTLYGSMSSFRARTRLTIDGDRAVITLAGGKRIELPVADLRGAEVREQDADDAKVYSTRIRIANGETIDLDDGSFSARDHYEKTAVAISRFLHEPGGDA